VTTVEFRRLRPGRPYINGLDIVRKPRARWIVDFGDSLTSEEAATYEAPFDFLKATVKPERQKRPEATARDRWWFHWRTRPDLRHASADCSRLIATPLVSKHRLFVWITPDVLASHAVGVFAREDDYFFGVLHSRAHEVWTVRMGTWLGKGNDPRYTPTTCFETIPLPWPPGAEPVDDPHVIAIWRSRSASASRCSRMIRINSSRVAWYRSSTTPAYAGRGRKGISIHSNLNSYPHSRGLDKMGVQCSTKRSISWDPSI